MLETNIRLGISYEASLGDSRFTSNIKLHFTAKKNRIIFFLKMPSVVHDMLDLS